MSHAFVKNDDGQAWTPPAARSPVTAHAVYGADEAREVLRASDDLNALLVWARDTARGEVRVRDERGTLLAVVDDREGVRARA
ncbi:hypothetical protein [Deinococcus maricopensis]|uniref:Uncharacterized protein n=1 Tax=Deinococcus maricopensis (strain DSM 21211 / LMG 22137 / NRRL B-23946 / LB-34) TaxID=709986 RepID=E8U5D1_DEIML|nr:hypothetical protein [Deinococcus maricopensis]ADV66270.1 hypothetical protein Deima_0612 [Deinococcus maricopensis DSM 21211]